MNRDRLQNVVARLSLGVASAAPQPAQEPPTPPTADEKWCLFCDKGTHRTDECHSTVAMNTPAQRELMRLAEAAQPAQDPWQPIETAPLLEIVLLCSQPNNSRWIGRWDEYRRHNQPRITHWMPLPAAPGASPQPQPAPLTDADRKDAERYRWLRDTEGSITVFAEASACTMDQDVDAAIDAARGIGGKA